MFNKNYLGHDMIKYQHRANKYICKTCTAIIRFDDNYFYSYEVKHKIINIYEHLITCNEMIIKKLLE